MGLADQLMVSPGSRVMLQKMDPSSTPDIKGKPEGERLLSEMQSRLARLQMELWAENRRGLLIVLQGMDTSGKDGTIRAVMSGVSPLGTRVSAFKAPSEQELDHDFLWRIHREIPGKGEIGIFNRSHYEDVLVVRVHDLVPKDQWEARYELINNFERMLAQNGVVIVKFFLHISKAEQKERLLERIKDPVKRWKFALGDLAERKRWDEYMTAYEDALSRCSTREAPWYVIPSDRKWYRNVAVASVLVETLENLKLKVPQPEWDPKTMVIED